MVILIQRILLDVFLLIGMQIFNAMKGGDNARMEPGHQTNHGAARPPNLTLALFRLRNLLPHLIVNCGRFGVVAAISMGILAARQSIYAVSRFGGGGARKAL